MQNIEKVCEFTIFLTKSQISKEFYLFLKKLAESIKLTKIERQIVAFEESLLIFNKNHQI